MIVSDKKDNSRRADLLARSLDGHFLESTLQILEKIVSCIEKAPFEGRKGHILDKEGQQKLQILFDNKNERCFNRGSKNGFLQLFSFPFIFRST